jgi:hypothetical protein
MFGFSDSKRTPEQILQMAPIEVTLGSQAYQIAPLRLGKAAAWRNKFHKEVGDVTAQMRQQTGSDSAFLSGLGYVLIQFPEKLLSLVLAYAPDLPKAKIKKEATDEQLAIAFGKILEVAFPFTGELKMIMLVMGPAVLSQK